MPELERSRPRGLSRRVIVDRALELGDAEGLDAVSLRRLATDLGVTPMALYRHVKDKQDLVNAMYETIVEGFDLRAGVQPRAKWTTQLRRALLNVIALHERPIAVQLVIAYSGGGSPAIWRMYETALEILMRAGFSRREAVEGNRMLSTLVAGYLLVFRQAPLPPAEDMLVARKRFELELFSLPRGEYPHVVASAPELVDAQFSDPQHQLKGTVDFMVSGVEALLEKRTRNAPRGRRRSSNSAAE